MTDFSKNPEKEKFLIDRSKGNLEGEGFPATSSQAFLHTADQLQCVLMSRVSRKRSAILIDEEYDLAGGFLKTGLWANL